MADAPAPSVSPARRAWLRFRRNRLGFASLLLFGVLLVLSLAAELISNDKPLVVHYDGRWYFPLIKAYPEIAALLRQQMKSAARAETF